MSEIDASEIFTDNFWLDFTKQLQAEIEELNKLTLEQILECSAAGIVFDLNDGFIKRAENTSVAISN